ncbi:MAG: hypothetical protein WA996_21135 [Candidatus Promineifilaceae bacterium]
MRKLKINKAILVFSVTLLLPLLISACGLGSAQPGRVPSPDWSRGVSLSSDVGGSIGLVVTGAADAVHLVWPTALDDQEHIHYYQLDDTGSLTVERDLELPEGRVRSPRLLIAGDDKLHLLWARRVEGSSNWELWHALLDDSGELASQASQISAPGTKVGSFVVTQDKDGAGYVVWEDDTAGGLFGVRILPGGRNDPVQLTESGSNPGISVGPDGDLHLAWIEPNGVMYASYPRGELGPANGSLVADLESHPSDFLDGPAVGVVDDQVYVVWSTFAKSGQETGTGRTEYVSFSLEDIRKSPSTRIWILPDEDQPYDPYTSSYPLTVLADPVISAGLAASYVIEPNTATPLGGELAMVVSAMQEHRLDNYVQIVLVVFEDGEFRGYQLAGKTESFSQDGLLFTDEAGELHLAWLEGRGNRLYYATTAPDVGSGLNRLGGQDFASVALGGGLDALTGVLFFPLSLVWFIPGFLLLGIYKLRRDDETVGDRTSQFLVVVAIISYQLSKALFMPTIISYVPFSAWVDIPDSMTKVLQVLIPLLSLTVGVVIAEIVRRRRPSTSALVYFLIVCGIDAALTLSVYGVGYLGYI